MIVVFFIFTFCGEHVPFGCHQFATHQHIQKRSWQSHLLNNTKKNYAWCESLTRSDLVDINPEKLHLPDNLRLSILWHSVPSSCVNNNDIDDDKKGTKKNHCMYVYGSVIATNIMTEKRKIKSDHYLHIHRLSPLPPIELPLTPFREPRTVNLYFMFLYRRFFTIFSSSALLL